MWSEISRWMIKNAGQKGGYVMIFSLLLLQARASLLLGHNWAFRCLTLLGIRSFRSQSVIWNMSWHLHIFLLSGLLHKEDIRQHQPLQHILPVGLHISHDTGHHTKMGISPLKCLTSWQAVIFYIPRCIWLSMEGGLMSFLVKGAQGGTLRLLY